MKKILFALLVSMLFVQSSPLWAEEKVEEEKNTVVILSTTMGEVEIELFDKKAPVTVKNFLRYVDEGFYKDTIFHRVIKNFMMQGGGFTKDFKRKNTHEPIANEADNGLTNDQGTIAMARTNIPNSATSQFFINFKNNSFLNHTSKTDKGWGYCVFGRVIKGMPVLKQVGQVQVAPKAGHRHVPATPIVIKSLKRK